MNERKGNGNVQKVRYVEKMHLQKPKKAILTTLESSRVLKKDKTKTTGIKEKKLSFLRGFKLPL